MVLDSLDSHAVDETYLSLASLMGLVIKQDAGWTDTQGTAISVNDIRTRFGEHIRNHTLIRRIEPSHFDVNAIPIHKSAQITASNDDTITFTAKRRQLPEHTPSNWNITATGDDDIYQVVMKGVNNVLFHDTKVAPVQSAGQLPTGFEPSKLYQSRHHPRTLQMTVYGASDALRSTGIEWETIRQMVRPDQIAVYAGSTLAQADNDGIGGLLKAWGQGGRPTSKQLPLAYPQMVADFINAYILGSVGATGASLGACASFLYNLNAGVRDIQEGKRQVVLVGSSDAPIIPEIMEGFNTMGALASDAALLALDAGKGVTQPDYRRACRPFAQNCGFTIGESAQFILLCSDSFALELGAQIFGAVPGVFVNADGFKKSITTPGVGNYITMAKSAALVRSMLGEQSLRERSFVHAHGTSTPQNRVTESHVLNETAKAFGIAQWPIAAIKAYIGHSQGVAAGDQLANTLGTWKYGFIPGIWSLDKTASDIFDSNLLLSQKALEIGATGMDSALLNSKGFGGNNATATVLAPHIVEKMLAKKHGTQKMKAYFGSREKSIEAAATYETAITENSIKPIYHFGQNVLDGSHMKVTDQSITVPGFDHAVDLNIENPFKDMC
jgi:acetoacetyl-[acyl-carrier protein] synthase